jgi:DNA polymerase-3 subunit beta
MTDNYAILTIPTAYLKAALICASTEQARYYLNGVYVDPKGFIVSTDGHRLFCAQIDLGDQAPFDGWIIPRDAIKQALNGYKGDVIEITQTRVGVVSCRPIDGTFPDWRRAMPEKEPTQVPAQFNPAYVADFGKIGDLLAGKKKASVLPCQIHHNGDQPTPITFGHTADCFGVLMPIRSSYAEAQGAADAWRERLAMIER